MKNEEMPDYWAEGETKPERAESGGSGVVIYSYRNGWKLKMTAEKPVLRNHNPANLKFKWEGLSQKKKDDLIAHARDRFGALTVDKDGYLVFPDWETGKRAADKWWEDARHDNQTINDAIDQFLSGDKIHAEKRKKDLEAKARGYRDKHGRPVNRQTLLSDLTDEQFIALRNYNNVQLEGWLNNLQNAKIEWIPPSQGAHAPARAGTRQPPTAKPPAPTSPITPAKPHSSLEAPPTPYRPASLDTGTPGPAQPVAGRNKLSPPDMSLGFPTQFADPFAPYLGGGLSPVTENPYVPEQGGPSRPNLLDSPSSFESLNFGSGNPPQVIAQPTGRPGGKNQVKAGQARKAPFYSLQDRLDFLGRVYRVAKPVSEATGLSLPFILAHAAHEVQFGKNIMENNLFNLKADKDWQGSTHLKGGNEYRSYPSYEESMKDYLTYLQADPRYSKMFEPATRASVGRLVDAIHYAGYSDDPLYTFRILAAAKDPIMKQALWQYQHWPPDKTPL
jgi:hypothetical protein